MKVNLIFSPLRPTGGIATWTFNMLEYIQSHHIKNVYHVDASIRFKNAKTRSRYTRLLSGILDTLVLIWHFWKALRRYRPNCVHVTTSASLALYKDRIYLLIASFFNVRVVFHYHFGRIPELERQRNWEWRQLKICMKRAEHAIVIDPLSYNVLCEAGFGGKVSYIPNPCSLFVESVAKQTVEEKKRKGFIFVGHVIPTKGIYELVESFVRLKDYVCLEIIGLCSNEIKVSLIKTASRKANGEWLSIVGNKSREYVLDKMKMAEALVLPSYTEGFPNVVLEAMACGCPVIATNVGAIAEMLSVGTENASGLCVSSRDVDKLENALKEFLHNDMLRERFTFNGKKKVLNCYTMEKIFPQYENVWTRE